MSNLFVNAHKTIVHFFPQVVRDCNGFSSVKHSSNAFYLAYSLYIELA